MTSWIDVAYSQDAVCVREHESLRVMDCCSLDPGFFGPAPHADRVELHLCTVPLARSPVTCALLAADAKALALSQATTAHRAEPLERFGLVSSDWRDRIRGNLDERIACVSDGNHVECARRGTGEVVGFCGGALDPGDDANAQQPPRWKEGDALTVPDIPLEDGGTSAALTHVSMHSYLERHKDDPVVEEVVRMVRGEFWEEHCNVESKLAFCGYAAHVGATEALASRMELIIAAQLSAGKWATQAVDALEAGEQRTYEALWAEGRARYSRITAAPTHGWMPGDRGRTPALTKKGLDWIDAQFGDQRYPAFEDLPVVQEQAARAATILGSP